MSQTLNYSLTLEPDPAEADLEAIRAGLHAFNTLAASDDNHQFLTLLVRDEEGRLLGGLLGDTYWGWLHIGILWLEESVRRRGYGSLLLAAAEAEAVRRGCRRAHLDTMSFQALPFYEKHGYKVWGRLEDLPQGHSRIYLSKRIDHRPSTIDKPSSGRCFLSMVDGPWSMVGFQWSIVYGQNLKV